MQTRRYCVETEKVFVFIEKATSVFPGKAFVSMEKASVSTGKVSVFTGKASVSTEKVSVFTGKASVSR